VDTNVALADLASGRAREIGTEYECGVHDRPPGVAGEHSQEEYAWTPIFLTSELHHGSVGSYRLDRRMDNADWLRSEMSAWEERRNKQQVKIHWSFTIAVARNKLKKLYPVVENSNLPM
jgi:hypothetical protein